MDIVTIGMAAQRYHITGQSIVVMPKSEARYDIGRKIVAKIDRNCELSAWIAFWMLNSSSIKLLKPAALSDDRIAQCPPRKLTLFQAIQRCIILLKVFHRIVHVGPERISLLSFGDV